MDRHRNAFRWGWAFWDLFLGHFLSFLPILSIITSLNQATITFSFDPCCSFLADLSLRLKSILYVTFRESFFKCTSNCVSLSASVFPIGVSTKIYHSPACKAWLNHSCCPWFLFLLCCPASGPLHLLFFLPVMLFSASFPLLNLRIQFWSPFHGNSLLIAQPKSGPSYNPTSSHSTYHSLN